MGSDPLMAPFHETDTPPPTTLAARMTGPADLYRYAATVLSIHDGDTFTEVVRHG